MKQGSAICEPHARHSEGRHSKSTEEGSLDGKVGPARMLLELLDAALP